jgi:DNA helicase HerA-like ATPase
MDHTMTQHSEHATNSELPGEAETVESPAAESPVAESQGEGDSLHAAAVDLAFDEETGGRPQASNEETRIGRVVSAGSQVIVMLENQALEGMQGAGETIQIGGLVKMRTPASTVFGMISGLSIPIPSEEASDAEMRIVQMELVGEAVVREDVGKAVFQRGVSFCPALGDGVYTTTQSDLKQVYSRPAASSVRVGTIYQDQTLPAFISTDDLLGKHFAILGTTGSGKSCAVALILRSILAQHSSGHALLLDLHNEYGRAFADCAEILGPGSLELPYWMLNFEEVREIVIGSGKQDREADTVILKEAILEAKRRYRSDGETVDNLSADTPVPYRLSDVTQQIDEALGKLDKPTDSAPYLRLKERFSALQADKRFSFMFQGLTVRDNMTAILSRIFRVPVSGKPVTILDLSGVPSEILNVVVSLLCRLTFDFALWSDRALPMLLVCEEAHRYVTQDANLGFEATKRALGRIAKEGRKYGVSLCVVSQRPSDLAVGILSQCNTIFAMRMSNQKDQEFVRGTLSESALGLLDSLPTLRTGEAIAVGEGVSVPVRLQFDTLPEERKPLSGTASFSAAWQNDDKDEAFVAEIVDRWRRQRR